MTLRSTSGGSLAQRVRKATGLDREEFAELLGINFHVVETWESGKRRPAGLALAFLRLIAANPRQAVEVLGQARRRHQELRGRILRTILRLGRGPQSTVPLHELREDVSFRAGPLGKEKLVGSEPEEINQALLRLEAERVVILDPPRHMGPRTLQEKEGGIRHKRRGLLAFVRPGPRFRQSVL